MTLFQATFRRSEQPRRWIMLIAALPFLFVGALGVEYRSAMLYLPVALLCILQFALPTIAGWAMISLVYALAVAALFWEIWISVIAFKAKQSRGVFVDTDDTILVVLLTICALGILATLVRSRPVQPGRRESLNHSAT